MTLYEGFDPQEGELVQFVGVYVLKWPFEICGEPQIAFREIDNPVYAAAPVLLEACKQALDYIAFT